MPSASPVLSRLLLVAEREISLLERCQGFDSRREIERVVAVWEAGQPASMRLRFPPSPDLAPLCRALEEALRLGAGGNLLARLYAGRAGELLLEARLVATRGTAAFRELAAERFPAGGPRERDRALCLARDWAALPQHAVPCPVLAEDWRNPQSLVRQVDRRVADQGLAFRVEVSEDLASVAATSEGVIRVRSGVLHGVRQGARIALHEVVGHAAPRARAVMEPLPVFRTGTVGASADEEGRALWLEERSGLMDDGRRRELGLRHLVAHAARSGADFVESVRLGVEHGAPARSAVELAARVHRGGGLAREVVYLPALLRVREALGREPNLEGWLERGRLGLDAARLLRALGPSAGEAQRNVATTGV